ncbi:MAG: oligosaccharide flippase family protein [Mariniphaga sp.]
MGVLKKLAGETVIYGLPSIVGRFLNWWLTPLYTWIFVPAEFGILSNILAYVAFLQVILTYGMETAYFRFASRSENEEKVFSTSMVSLGATSILFILFILIFSKSIASLIDYEGHQNYIIWMGFTVAFDSLCSIPFAKLRLQSKPIKFAIFKLINIALSIVLNIFWIYLCPKILASNPNSIVHYLYSDKIGIGYAFISYLSASLVTLVLFIPNIKIKKDNFDIKILYELLKYGWPILIIGISGMVNMNIDKILLPKLTKINPIGELGIYSASSKLAILMSLFIQAFRFSFEPFLFSHYKNEDSKKVYAIIMKYFVILGLSIFLGVIFYMDIFKYFIGSTKMGYHDGIKVVPWLLMGNLFLGIFYTQSLWYKLTDQTHFGARIAIIGAVINLIVNITLIPFLGYMACGYAFFVSSLVMTVISYIVGHKYFPVIYDMRRIFSYFLFSIILYISSKYVVFDNIFLRNGFNTLLFFTFIFYIWIKEKSDLKGLVKFK